jgi:hypothetical protein
MLVVLLVPKGRNIVAQSVAASFGRLPDLGRQRIAGFQAMQPPYQEGRPTGYRYYESADCHGSGLCGEEWATKRLRRNSQYTKDIGPVT